MAGRIPNHHGVSDDITAVGGAFIRGNRGGQVVRVQHVGERGLGGDGEGQRRIERAGGGIEGPAATEIRVADPRGGGGHVGAGQTVQFGQQGRAIALGDIAAPEIEIGTGREMAGPAGDGGGLGGDAGCVDGRRAEIERAGTAIGDEVEGGHAAAAGQGGGDLRDGVLRGVDQDDLGVAGGAGGQNVPAGDARVDEDQVRRLRIGGQRGNVGEDFMAGGGQGSGGERGCQVEGADLGIQLPARPHISRADRVGGSANIGAGEGVQAGEERRPGIAVADFRPPKRDLRMRGHVIGPGGHGAALGAERRGVEGRAAKFDRTRGAVGEELQALQIGTTRQRPGDLIDAGTGWVEHHHLHIGGDADDQLLPVGHPRIDEQDLRRVRDVRLP